MSVEYRTKETNGGLSVTDGFNGWFTFAYWSNPSHYQVISCLPFKNLSDSHFVMLAIFDIQIKVPTLSVQDPFSVSVIDLSAYVSFHCE